jgi:phosphoacetylglucosamine mutase
MDRIIAASLEVAPNPRFIAYGTAGFRTVATDLPQVFFRSGLIALLRAFETKKMIGLMVTASHNPIADNGLKIVDFTGEMLPISWEKTAETIANASDLAEALQEKWPESPQGRVLVGHDNRPSSVGLVECIKKAIGAAECSVFDFGEVTTPQFHYLVRECNGAGEVVAKECYLVNLQNKASALLGQFSGGIRYENRLQLDCSGGVGFAVMQTLNLDWIELINSDPSELNLHCGAEYAHKERKLPRNMQLNKKSASFDGDADRVVYYKSSSDLEVLGGERLTVLYAAAIKKLMNESNISTPIHVVTTGYSNFASLNYLTSQGISYVIVPTGVKYLHEEAHKHEISVYFEANGHGTILYHASVIAQFKEQGASSLASFLELANTTVGDAVADLLLAEVALRVLDWSLDDWSGLYQDLPNVMVAVRTPMKDLIINTWDQMEVLQPETFAREVKELVARHTEDQARTLIRPSGTEPIVRIYVEATSIEVCRELVQEITKRLN